MLFPGVAKTRQFKTLGRNLAIIVALLVVVFLLKEAIQDRDIFRVLGNIMLLCIAVYAIFGKNQHSRIIYRCLGVSYLFLVLSGHFVEGMSVFSLFFFGAVSLFVAFVPEIRAWQAKHSNTKS